MFVFIQFPQGVMEEEETVRIFVEFQRVESAIKGYWNLKTGYLNIAQTYRLSRLLGGYESVILHSDTFVTRLYRCCSVSNYHLYRLLISKHDPLSRRPKLGSFDVATSAFGKWRHTRDTIFVFTKKGIG